MSTQAVDYVPYKVKDISLADWGRKGNRIGRGRNARVNVLKKGV